jgi:protein N-terminal methyltransferase
MIDNEQPETKEKWYSKSKEFWEKSEATVEGMLEGNDIVHNSDVKTSCELIEGLILIKKLTPGTVLDCGAGIGRVTSNVLLNYFEKVDLMEQDEKFCQKCKEIFLGNSKIKNIFQSSFQNFVFQKENEQLKYDVIWIQWCVENIDDQDLITFLTKCRNALNPKGLVIVKENIVGKGTLFVPEDFSRVRSDVIFRNVFTASGFRIIKHFHHPNWPKDMMKVSVFVLTEL